MGMGLQEASMSPRQIRATGGTPRHNAITCSNIVHWQSALAMTFIIPA